MAKERKAKELIFVIEYRVEPQYCNTEEILDKLRETGAAEIVDARVEDVKES